MLYIKKNGKFRFTPEEWLTTKQIKSFFSNITRDRRKKANSAVCHTQKNSQCLRSNEDESNVNVFVSISVINTHTHSDVDDDDMEQIMSDSNNEVNDNDEETSDDDFDARISAMDMRDMLTAAK